MVKIEIDDAVRDYALDYSHRVMATCADVEEKLAELGTFVADNNNWNDNNNSNQNWSSNNNNNTDNNGWGTTTTEVKTEVKQETQGWGTTAGDTNMDW